MEFVVSSVAVLAAYLLGSIPTGYLVGKARGVDIRQAGSGNIGATNTFRVLGKKAGTFVLVADALKGYAACRFFPVLAWRFSSAGPIPSSSAGFEFVSILAGLAAIVGHNFPCWLGFKGGKGIATSAGVMLALVPAGFAVALGIWLLVVAASRYISLGSVAAAAALPFAVWATTGSVQFVIVAGAVGALAIHRHRSNIRRLLNGTENRLGRTKVPGQPL